MLRLFFPLYPPSQSLQLQARRGKARKGRGVDCFIEKKKVKKVVDPKCVLKTVPYPTIGLIKWANKSFSMWVPCQPEVTDWTSSGRKWDPARRHSVRACPSKQPSPSSTHTLIHILIVCIVIFVCFSIMRQTCTYTLGASD